MTLAAAVARWHTGAAGRLAPNSRRAYASALTVHVLPTLGACDVTALTTRTIRAWLQTALAIGHPRASVHAYLTALSTVLTDAVLDGLLERNPAHGAARRLWPRPARPRPKALTPDELAALVHAADCDPAPWLGPFVRVASRTGLRLGELLGLTPAAVLPALPAVRVVQQYHGGGEFGPPKGDRSRVVDVSPATCALLLARPGAYCFPGRSRARASRFPLSPWTVESAVARAVARAQLPPACSVHTLRHTYASQLLAAGAPAPYVQQQLGHASYAITVDLYGSWLPSHRPDLVALRERVEPQRHPPRRAPTARVMPLRGHRVP